MNICRILSFTYFAGLLLLCLHTISGEYNIMDVVPSYMYRKFDNVAEEIFPEEIRIKVSLSYISGTLLYSIDKHMNQLIVSLDNSVYPYIELEFRKKSQYISLYELCECENCYYEMLEFFIEIKDTLNLQCNGRAVRKYKYNEAKELNSEYPILYSDQNLSPGSPNEAHLWLVNTPYYKDLYPNQEQMLGCIFQVKYKGLPIIFTEITDKIEQKCKKKCVDNICNGGTCHETHNVRAICNCTETFLNGLYCNETLIPKNLRSHDLSFKFTLLKVSWKSWSKKFLDLSNKNVQLELKCSRHTLLFNINYYKDFNNIQHSLILRGYIPNKEYILLVTLSEKNVDIKFFNEGIWRLGRLDSKTDLRSETFTNLTLRSEGGMLGLAFKHERWNHEWWNVEIKKYEHIKDGLMYRILTENINSRNNISVVIGVVVVLVISIIYWIINKWLRRTKNMLKISEKDSKEDNKEEEVKNHKSRTMSHSFVREENKQFNNALINQSMETNLDSEDLSLSLTKIFRKSPPSTTSSSSEPESPSVIISANFD